MGGDLVWSRCGPEPSPEPFKPFKLWGSVWLYLLILYPCFSPSSTLPTHLEEAEACGFPAGVLYRHWLLKVFPKSESADSWEGGTGLHRFADTCVIISLSLPRGR